MSDKLKPPQPVRNSLPSMEHKVHHIVWSSLPHFSVPSLINSVHNIWSLSYKLHFSIILPPWIWYPSPPEPCMLVSLPHTDLLIILNLKTLIIFYEQHKSWRSTLRNFLQPPVISALFLKPHNLYSLPSMSETKMHTHTKQQQNYSSIYFKLYVT